MPVLRIVGEVLRQHLDGYIPVQRRVPCLVHLPHAARAERLDDLVVAGARRVISTRPGG